MANEQKEGLDRRDFMMAAIGLVGASASLASSAGTANAQDTKDRRLAWNRAHCKERSTPAM